MDLPVRYVLLRDDLDWIGDIVGLTKSPDGTLSLTRVPAPEPGAAIRQDGPFDAEPSGIAAYSNDQILIADTDSGRIIFDQRNCNQRFATSIDGTPAGLAIANDVLYVADVAGARVMCFALPSLELRRVIDTGLRQPTGVAVDSQGRLYVLDRAAPARVVRFGRDGTADTAYAPALTAPRFLTIGPDDSLYVSDSGTDTVQVIGEDGTRLGTLTFSLQSPGVQPRALVAHANLVLVADATSGTISVFDATSRACIGSVPNVQARVSAMAFDDDGNLLLKHDGGKAYVRLTAGSGYVATGRIVAQKLDAGRLNGWERVAVTARDAASGVELFTCVRADTATPLDADWVRSPNLDCLLARDPGPDNEQPEAHRHLWLRVVLTSADATSPHLEQVQAQTVGISYLERLPRIFRRDDRDTRFLERWLALFRSAFEAREDAIEFARQTFDPLMAPADRLDWLARTLAFDVPESLTPTEARALIARIARLYARRGTLEGVRDMAEVYAGIRPRIIEAFHARRVWQLGTTSLLGFDTTLAASTPEGFVVPHDAPTDQAYAGLRGDYYRGTDFNELLLYRTDEWVNFGLLSVLDEKGEQVPAFTVRWSGQIKPRYSETYLLRVEHGEGVRLWIDGRPLIDSWVTGSTSEARTVLDADRWHAIQLEIRSLTPTTIARLSWSSRRQLPEAVPSTCLYSVLDEHANLTPPRAATFDVGHAVVGESGSLPASAFGEGLFGDYAHLFTVLAPAGSCRDAQHRAALRDVIDAEKPAHTDYHLCFVEPRMRVGFQARLGIDAIVADGQRPLRLDGTELGRNSYLDAERGGARVAVHAALGRNTVVA